MAKGIFYLKMALLLGQTDIFHQKEIREIHVMSEFIAVFYCKWWFKSPLSIAAPSQDLIAVSTMRKYNTMNPEVATPCLESMYRHGWYLTEELAVLCLANDDLPDNVRKEVAIRLYTTERGAYIAPDKPEIP